MTSTWYVPDMCDVCSLAKLNETYDRTESADV